MKKKTVEDQAADKVRASRRSFLKKAAVGAAGAAVAVAPTIHVAQAPISLRFQSPGRRRTSSTSTRSTSPRR